VMTVGPMIVRTRDAPLGSPTHAWIKPAPIEATPAATATHPSLRERLFGHTLAAFTARLPEVEFALGPPYQPPASGLRPG
jgi:hypothetical protein